MKACLIALGACVSLVHSEILPMPEGGWPRQGSLLLEFSLPDMPGTLRAVPEYTQGYFGGPLFKLPFVEARLWTSRSGGLTHRSGINFNVRTTAGNEKTQQLVLSRLDGDKRYQILYTWDVDADAGTAFLQGVAQSDLGHWGEDLLEDGARARLPETEWVLEGPNASAVATEHGLRLLTTAPEDRRDGHIVLWNTRPMPADFLFEYSFTPQNSERGLGIVFFNTRNPEGESIFDLELPPRHGRFREYIVGGIDSYHVSPWATDDTQPRRTANLRKNSGFMLVSVGNDLIGGFGPGPHTVRILKRGGNIQVESNGTLALEFQDDGVSHGPVHSRPGLIGLRFMAHSGEVTLHSMRVWALAEE